MTYQEAIPYHPKHKVRIVTAASLFDGHDAAINIMRRILQRTGAEIIHIGHNRSVDTIVNTAIQEDVQGIAITSYQGGHTEFLKYMYDLLQERGASHIKVFAGGGGTILPTEIEALHQYGITRIYSPDDGRAMGLQGMINHLIESCDFPIGNESLDQDILPATTNHNAIARLISVAENNADANQVLLKSIHEKAINSPVPVLGITGTGGAGKSSLVDEIIRRFLMDFEDRTIGIISVDPTKRKTGGALLGDRIRMNAVNHPNVYMRSLATRQSNLALSKYVQAAVDILKVADFDLIILETSGIGQSDTEIIDHSSVSLYVMTPEYGAASQLEKIDMLDFADFIAVNKFDKRGAEDAVRDVAKQFQRNHLLWDKKLEEMPVIGTIASQFNDPGTTKLYRVLMDKLKELNPRLSSDLVIGKGQSKKQYIIPPRRVRYLSEIADEIRKYQKWALSQSELARYLFSIQNTIKWLQKEEAPQEAIELLKKSFLDVEEKMDRPSRKQLEGWADLKKQYEADEFVYHVRKKAIKVPTFSLSLSQTRIPRVILPKYKDWGEIMYWILMENVPGSFPYAAGVFPFKRKGEDPTRMFAGEGGPERTNRRFHYVSGDMPYARLSTAFDSVTLYGEDPHERPDIYGKVGNSGVSICSLDDAKRLYSGFDLCSPKTSVSMTINGPASIMTAFFMNVAIDQECEKYIKENGLENEVEAAFKKKYDDRDIPRPTYREDIPKGNDGLGLLLLGLTGDEVLAPKVYAEIKAKAIASVRGTIQADILKEDQAQNTCIFSTEYSLRLMGDMQQYFNDNGIRNFYSVSISGYHIAEAGANPITQLAFTLANGFTYVEYYLSRGMDIDSFAPNLSFFFSNGLDPEYVVIGKVARRIWAKAMKLKYEANDRSQKLKYHIQTSGRSLHAQEISFNDIRTTLQALYAIYDNCNSLHTNAYDEAITTPTEESVRRAMAIQLIINHESGLAKNENPNQGSFIIDELTELVEEAVLTEFDRITDRGGVLGAMETMYQRSKIQEESLYYETLKSTGELPIMGVNTFLSKEGSPTIIPSEVIRAEESEKKMQIDSLNNLHKTFSHLAPEALLKLQELAVKGGNIFEELMLTTKYCSLGQITNAMFSVGGEYRRSM